MRNRLAVAFILALALAFPAFAQASEEITEEEVAEALDRRTAAAASLEETTARFEKAISDEMLTRERVVELSKSVAVLEQEIGTRRTQVKELVKARYMSGGSLGTERMFTARTFTDLPVQDEYYEVMNAQDLSLLRGLESAEVLLVEQQDLLDETLSKQAALVMEIGDLTDKILGQLEMADAEYNAIAIAYEEQEIEKRRIAEEARLRRIETVRQAAEEAARQATSTTTTVASTPETTVPTTVAPATVSDESTSTTAQTTTTQAVSTTTTTHPPAPPPIVAEGKACPVNAASSFTDSWGAPRSGDREHEGVDMVAARGAPLVAIESGTIARTAESALGGISIYLTGISGNRYYYAHLDSLAEGIVGGLSVSVGDLVGYNGSSGNATYDTPHLHFQYAPPGGTWINPYSLVKVLCG
jgi:murein DD-endopeptidase MepM/ murein hydrolase activator NlpD